MSEMTNKQFSQQCSNMASRCSQWAAEALDEDLSGPVYAAGLARFLSAMRERLDRIEEWAATPSTTQETKGHD